MKFFSKNILVLFVVILQACTIDSNISERDYPVIKSLGIKDLNESGVNIDFMIIQNNSSAIESYGVQYRAIEKEGSANISIPEYFFYEEISGKPQGNPQSIRLKYDLIPGLDYFARPFVRSGSQMIFGESFNFSSLGVKGPEITSVSESKLFRYHSITIEGNYFSRKPENNILDFGGLEAYFNFRIMEATPTKLVVEAVRNSSLISSSGQEFDLKISVNGKTAILKEAFEIGIPNILTVSPTQLSVGENITIELSYLIEMESTWYLIDANNIDYRIPTSINESNKVVGEIPNMPPGKYKLAFRIQNYSEINYEKEIIVNDNWVSSHENIPRIVEGYYSNFSTGNDILTYNYGTYFDIHVFNLAGNSMSKLADFPDNGRGRAFYALSYMPKDNKLYFGLGNQNDFPNPPINYSDFYRLDLVSKNWEQLPNFLDGPNAVKFSFEYDGKLTFVFYNRSNFYFFNPALKIWEDSGIQVPIEIKNATNILSNDGTIFFPEINSNVLKLFSVKIGQSPKLLGEFSGFYDQGYLWSIISFGNSIFLAKGNKNIFEYNLADERIKPVQGISAIFREEAKFYKDDNNLYLGFRDYAYYDDQFRLFKFVR